MSATTEGTAHRSPSLKPLTWLILAVVTGGLLSGCASRTLADDGPLRLRILAYNIHHCAGMDGVVDVERIARIINDANVDLVSLQEVDMMTERNGRVDQAAELGRLTGMHSQFGKAIDYQGGEYGQAILSRWPIENFETHLLPSEPDQEQRIAVVATIAATSERPAILFAGTHLHHREEALRLPQARRLLDILREAPQEIKFLTGDLNAIPTSETMQLIKAEWEDTSPDDAFTIPSGVPNRKIDYILLPKGHQWRVVQAEVLDEPIASDHRPVVVELEWRGEDAR